MKRRNFFKIAAPMASAPFVFSGSPLAPLFKANFLNSLNCEGVEDRVLVVVNMGGGNDGINMFVPMEQYDQYVNVRPNIHLKDTGPNAFTPLDNTLALNQQVGLHPGMEGFKTLYDAGLVHIIQGTGYSGGMNGSHFKGTDLWLTGGDGGSNFNKSNGWMGRYLDYSFPGVYGNPTPALPDPPALRFTDIGQTGFDSYSGQTAVGLFPANPYFYYLASDGIEHPTSFPNSHYGTELLYLSQTQASSDGYSARMNEVVNAGSSTPSVTYPDTSFGNQLKSVARYMSGGVKSKIFYTNLGHRDCCNFDTHAHQIQGSSHIGPHATLLNFFSEAVKAFYDDINALGLADRVLLVTFSEFGRTAWENGQLGTEHGNYGPMIVIGNAVRGGMTGTNVDLFDLENLGGLQTDHRQVYTTLLQDWLGAADDVIQAAEMGDFSEQKIDLINTSNIVSPDCYISNFVLPIDLLFFKATLNEQKEVVLDWATASEVDNDYFEVQRSQDGKDFFTIEKVYSVGSPNNKTTYQTIDKSPLVGLSYYRLKQVDFNGKFTYSDVQSIEIATDKIKAVKLYPNPAIFDTKLVFTTQKAAWIKVAIYNSNGIIVRHERFKAQIGFNKRSYEVKGLTNGQYMVRVEAEDLKFQQSLPLVVQ